MPTYHRLSTLGTNTLFFFCFAFLLFRATPAAHGGSQVRGPIGATAASLRQHQIQAACATYTTAHGHAGSLPHWASPGIEPATPWFLVGFVSAVPQRELQIHRFLFYFIPSICWSSREVLHTLGKYDGTFPMLLKGKQCFLHSWTKNYYNGPQVSGSLGQWLPLFSSDGHYHL